MRYQRGEELRTQPRGGIKTFRDLVAWERAMQLAREVYKVTSLMPPDERFGLTMQMRRSAVSVPPNIAEGHGRQSLTDYLRFLKTARGSLMELQTQLLFAKDLGFIRLDGGLSDLTAETDRVLQGLIRSLDNVQSEQQPKQSRRRRSTR